MSRIGMAPIPLPEKVSVNIEGQEITVSGPRGTLQRTIHPRLSVVVQDNVLNVQRDGEDRQARALHGLTRALVYNMVVGVSAGHSRALLVTGIGYRCEQVGKMVKVAAGFSHQVMIAPSEGVELKVETVNRILVSGCDKELVGDMAARIRGMRPIRPYIFRGDFQGVRYADETPRRKAGKQGAKR